MGPGRICSGDRRTRERQGHGQGRSGEIGRSCHPVEQRRREHHGDQQATDHLEGAPDDDRPTAKEQGCGGEGHGSDHHLRDRSQFTLDVAEGERDQAEGAHEEQQHTQVRQTVDGEVGGDRLTRAGPPPEHRPRRSLQPLGTLRGVLDRGLGTGAPTHVLAAPTDSAAMALPGSAVGGTTSAGRPSPATAGTGGRPIASARRSRTTPRTRSA